MAALRLEPFARSGHLGSMERPRGLKEPTIYLADVEDESSRRALGFVWRKRVVAPFLLPVRIDRGQAGVGSWRRKSESMQVS